jgi:hypothetical protein
MSGNGQSKFCASITPHKTGPKKVAAQMPQPSPHRRDLELLEAILTNCGRLGPESQNRLRLPNFRAHLEGRIGFVEMINRTHGQRLRGILKTSSGTDAIEPTHCHISNQRTPTCLALYSFGPWPKRSGRVHLIESPKPLLKELRRRILSGILNPIPVHPANVLHGFGPGIRLLASNLDITSAHSK